MADSVKVFGQEMSKKTLYIGGAAAAGILGYAWWKHHSSASSSAGSSTGTTGGSVSNAGASSAGGDPYPSDGSSGNPADPYSLDPATGITYGDEQGGVGNYGGSGYYGTSGFPSGYDPYTNTTTPTTPQDNATWEQTAISDLEAGGVSQSVVNDATSGLPRYLAKLTLSSAQASAVQMAVALAGPPPTGGPYTIRISQPSPKPHAKDVDVPNVVGENYTDAANRLKSAGLVARRGSADVGIVNHQNPAAGHKVKKGTEVVLSGSGAKLNPGGQNKTHS